MLFLRTQTGSLLVQHLVRVPAKLYVTLHFDFPSPSQSFSSRRSLCFSRFEPWRLNFAVPSILLPRSSCALVLPLHFHISFLQSFSRDAYPLFSPTGYASSQLHLPRSSLSSTHDKLPPHRGHPGMYLAAFRLQDADRPTQLKRIRTRWRFEPLGDGR